MLYGWTCISKSILIDIFGKGDERYVDICGTWMNLSCQITGGDIPSDEFVGNADNVTEVGGQFETKNSKLKI